MFPPACRVMIEKAALFVEVARKKLLIGHVRIAFTDEDYTKIGDTNKIFPAIAASRGFAGLFVSKYVCT